MATAQLIDHNNFSTLLVQSTQGRSGTPDGNIFFNTATGEVEIITAEDLSQVDLGSGLEANPLTDYDGITMRALYNFERQERSSDETLRQFDYWFEGSYKYAGAYELVNGRKFATNGNVDDRSKIRASGWLERATDNSLDRIYIGVRSLNHIDADSQPYQQLAAGTSDAQLQAAAPTNFARLGPIDEAVQVYGSTANGDAGAGDFDYTGYVLVASVRKFGNSYGRTTSVATGIGELNGFSAGFGIGEASNDANSYDLADVFGGAQIAPWTGMSYEAYAVNQTRTGFTGGSADFDTIIHNASGGSLLEVRAFMDALELQDTDVDDGSGTYYGKRGNVLYTLDDQGRVVTRQGLHIDNLPEADKQNVVQTDVTGTGQTYPFNVDVRIEVGSFAVADPNAWYHVFFLDGAADQDFNNVNAVTVNDASGNPVKGNVQTDAIGTQIRFAFAYDTNTQAGLSAGIDKDLVVEVEGDGTATAAKTVFTVTRQAIVSATCSPGQETNA